MLVEKSTLRSPTRTVRRALTGFCATARASSVWPMLSSMTVNSGELNSSFLVVTHDPRLADRCDRVIELVDGRIERDERRA